MSNSLTLQDQQIKNLTTIFSSPASKKRMNDIAGSGKGDLIISNTISSIQQNPKLAECTPQSLMSAALAGHALGLNFATHEAYFVPFKNTKKGVTEAQFQMGWKGLIQLAERSGQYKKINAIELKEGELKKFDRLTEDYEIEFIEDDEKREKMKSTHYIAYIELMTGFKKVMIWSREKMEAHALKYSQMYKYDKSSGKTSSHWSLNFDMMAIKTMLKQIIDKFGAKSVEMNKAIVQDQAVLAINEENNEVVVDSYIDNQPNVEVVEETGEVEPPINNDQMKELTHAIVQSGRDVAGFLMEKGIKNANEITNAKFNEFMKELGAVNE